jgi:hypothetical protein
MVCVLYAHLALPAWYEAFPGDERLQAFLELKADTLTLVATPWQASRQVPVFKALREDALRLKSAAMEIPGRKAREKAMEIATRADWALSAAGRTGEKTVREAVLAATHPRKMREVRTALRNVRRDYFIAADIASAQHMLWRRSVQRRRRVGNIQNELITPGIPWRDRKILERTFLREDADGWALYQRIGRERSRIATKYPFVANYAGYEVRLSVSPEPYDIPTTQYDMRGRGMR